MNVKGLRDIARALFDAGVRAADPFAAVTRELQAAPLPYLSGGQHIILAIGKAAGAMVKAAIPHVPEGNIFRAIVVTNYENAKEIPGCTVIAAGHPLPDENGLAASELIIQTLKSATSSDNVLCLISGGGSALLPAPANGLTLADKIAVNQILLADGFDIVQTNLIRQQLSKLKGGRLAALAAPAVTRSLIISDVIGDDPAAIASGPTAAPLGTRQDAVELLKSRKVWSQVPLAVRKFLKTTDVTVPAAGSSGTNTIVCSNWQCLEAIAGALRDWNSIIVTSTLGGDVADAAQLIMAQIMETPQQGDQLLIWGGETTVQLHGTGKGGRNQELALRFSKLSDELTGEWVFLSGGTDGRDGPTDVAGGIVDSNTVERQAAEHLDVATCLANNDSYHALEMTEDLLMTGPTGTNVADIQLFLRVE